MPASAASEPLIWSSTEQLPRAELQALQLERLRATFDVELDSLAQVAELPFTDKASLRAAYPFGLLRVPVEALARVHASSGTHGKPTVVGYTAADLDAWTELMARCMTMAGVRPGMLVHNANGYGLFTGGLGFHQGAERIGAPVVPVSGGNTARQVMLLHDLGAQVLVATPSYAVVIAQAVAEAGIDPAALRLELGLFGGEPWTEELREEIERLLPGLRAVNFYGLSEMCGPGVATECLEVRDGLHVHEDHFLVEVVDPESGTPLPDGVEGELVFTTLVKEAMPLLRYRTGDLGSLELEPCGCGRTTARIRGLRGRRDDMVVIRGVNVYPSNVEHALLSIADAAPHYRLVVDRTGPMAELTVQCEPADADVDREALRAEVEQVLADYLAIRVRAEVLEPGQVPRSEGKAVRVVDRR
ncbi:MAG TPA: phenylacetate--CoA ligase [Gaiellaceae bacterium]|nr:phenylacetate--CoA ligase [Gaiellaceae bacterium]